MTISEERDTLLMRTITRLPALVAVLLLALTLGRGGVAAQDTGMGSPVDVENLEGIQAGGNRIYTADFSAMTEGTPGADDMSLPAGVLALTGGILQFDSDDNASKAYDQVAETFTDPATMGLNSEPEDVDLDLGDKSTSITFEEDIEGMKLSGAFTVVQAGEYVYFAGASGSEFDAGTTVKDFTTKLIDNDAGDDEPQFNADGTSTGGFWNKFPAADDELVAGLSPTDMQLYPVMEGGGATTTSPSTPELSTPQN